ncbi:MAG: penicillin-binding protein 2 [Planctomycetota bacterium]
MASRTSDPSAGRARWVAAALGIGATAWLATVLVRVAWLQIAPPERIDAVLAARERQHTIRVPRADVADRRGRPLAVSRYVHRVFFDPVRVAEEVEAGRITVAELSSALAWMTGEDEFDVDRRVRSVLRENEARQREARRASTDANAIADPIIRYVRVGDRLDDERLAIVRAHPLPGIHLEREAIRDRVGGDLVAPILGKIGSDPMYDEGIERMLRARLEGEPGTITYTHDAGGRAVWIGAGEAEAPRAADAMHLSIDLEIQRIVREELDRAVEDADAAGGLAIALDPRTGEVLAMADVLRPIENEPYPWIDGRLPREEWPRHVDLTGRYAFVRPDPRREDDPAIARNRVIEDAYEPGSTFKALVWSALIDHDPTLLDEVFEAAPGGVTMIGGRRLRDTRANGEQTWEQVLVNSSNIGMAAGVQRIPPADLRRTLSAFGIGERTRLSLPDEAPGRLRGLRDWGEYTHVSVSFGQEVLCTVAQIARAFCAIARNGDEAGTVPALRLTAVGLDGYDGLVARRAVSPAAALRTRTATLGIIERLDAKMRDERPFSYRMFGKSGTAQVSPEKPHDWQRLPPGANAYLPRQYVSSFVAGAPLGEPRIVVMVSIEDPGPDLVRSRQFYGSSVAGPSVRRIVERVLPYLGVPPDAELASSDERPEAADAASASANAE